MFLKDSQLPRRKKAPRETGRSICECKNVAGSTLLHGECEKWWGNLLFLLCFSLNVDVSVWIHLFHLSAVFGLLVGCFSLSSVKWIFCCIIIWEGHKAPTTFSFLTTLATVLAFVICWLEIVMSLNNELVCWICCLWYWGFWQIPFIFPLWICFLGNAYFVAGHNDHINYYMNWKLPLHGCWKSINNKVEGIKGLKYHGANSNSNPLPAIQTQ